MALKITVDSKNYKSDQLPNGRIVKDFFSKLSRNVFNQAYAHYCSYAEIADEHEMPLLFPERNMYSHFAVAINKITSIHMSELSFNKSDHFDESEYADGSINNRRVDFWCLSKNGEQGKPINYYIELKNGWFCSSKKSNGDFRKDIKGRYTSLIEQIDMINFYKPKFDDFDDVYMGIFIVCDFHVAGKQFYTSKDILKKFKEMASEDNDQFLVSTWTLPDNLRKHEDGYEYRSISLFGIIRGSSSEEI